MIPVNEPLISESAKQYVRDCIDTGWVSSSGKYIELFEKEFAKYIGVKYAVTTTSGTTALHLALAALDIGQGDEVIIPDLTIISCALAVIYTGAKPVFIDVDPLTGTIDPSKIEEKITKKTKAIMPVHLYGYAAEMDTIKKLANKHKLYVIEDGAEALGTTYKGKKAGSLSTAGCFSFYGNKLITTGEGGMVVTNNKALYKKIYSLKNLAHSSKRRFLHFELGFNYRMTNLQAALGIGQLEQINNYVAKKKWIFDQYQEKLKKNQHLTLPTPIKNVGYVCWMYTVLLRNSASLSKQALMLKLKKLGIDTREFFIPMHRQPILIERGLIDKYDTFPVSEDLSGRGLYLPSGLTLTEGDIENVSNAINKSLSI